MPLDRDHVTVATVSMLPAYVVIDVLFGVVFITDPGNRMGLAPSLEPARALIPLWALGVLWLALSALIIRAWVTRSRDRCMAALAIDAAAWAMWGVMVEVAIFTQPNVTFLAGVLPVGWAWAHRATIKSLRAREV